MHWTFIILAPAAPPSSLSANDVGAQSVNITWRRPKYTVIDYYTVQLSNTSKNDSWANFTTVNGNMESTTVQGLIPDMEYFLRMEGTNVHGTGERKSNILKIQTKKLTQKNIPVSPKGKFFLQLHHQRRRTR